MTRHRERSAHRAQRSVESELADEQSRVEGIRFELSRRHEDPKCNRKIEGGSFFSYIGRRKIDRDSAWRNVESGIQKRCTHALAAFLDGARGQSDDRPLRKARRCIDFHGDVIRVDADQRG